MGFSCHINIKWIWLYLKGPVPNIALFCRCCLRYTWVVGTVSVVTVELWTSIRNECKKMARHTLFSTKPAKREPSESFSESTGIVKQICALVCGIEVFGNSEDHYDPTCLSHWTRLTSWLVAYIAGIDCGALMNHTITAMMTLLLSNCNQVLLVQKLLFSSECFCTFTELAFIGLILGKKTMPRWRISFLCKPIVPVSFHSQTNIPFSVFFYSMFFCVPMNFVSTAQSVFLNSPKCFLAHFNWCSWQQTLELVATTASFVH